MNISPLKGGDQDGNNDYLNYQNHINKQLKTSHTRSWMNPFKLPGLSVPKNGKGLRRYACEAFTLFVSGARHA